LNRRQTGTDRLDLMSNSQIEQEASMFNPKVVTLSPRTRAAVLDMLAAHGNKRSLNELVEEVLQDWLAQATRDDPETAHEVARGYQWKSLFLPDGTLLRFYYKGQYEEASVVGNEIRYQGWAYSPRQLIYHITGTVRNAWRTLWIRSPGDFRWHLADTRRRILRRTPRPDARVVTPAPRRSFLRSDDIVRDDQPDLSWNRGGGWLMAGRSGKRDRRACNGFINIKIPPRADGKDAQEIALLRAPAPAGKPPEGAPNHR
jgi:hypothetical protein